MRHRKARNRLGRDSSHRKAMLRNMANSLFKHEQLETTDAKAKELRPVAEKMITLAKKGDLHARRRALAYLQDKAVTHRLFEELKDRYLERQGGYVRIIKKGIRRGDGASVSVVQLLPEEKTKRKRKSSAAKESTKTKSKKEAVMKAEKRADKKTEQTKQAEENVEQKSGAEQKDSERDS